MSGGFKVRKERSLTIRYAKRAEKMRKEPSNFRGD